VKTLAAFPTAPNFTYQWFEKTKGALAGATNSTLTVNETGEYFFQATPTTLPTCPSVAATPVKITVVKKPIVSFSAPAEGCRGNPVSFTNQTIVDPQIAVQYAWEFGDLATSTEVNPSHTYANAQSYTVKLTASYQGSCAANVTKNINVLTAPDPVIAAPNNVFAICQGETITLSVTGSFPTYLWSTGETTPTITVTKDGAYSVTVTNTGGCSATASRNVQQLDSTPASPSADPPAISAGQTTQLVVAGLTNPIWSPGKTLSDSTISNPIAQPPVTTIYTVKGELPSGCVVSGTIEVRVEAERITGQLIPDNFFPFSHPIMMR